MSTAATRRLTALFPAGRTLWLFPVALFGVAVVFLSSGGGTLGGTYLVAGFVTAVALSTAQLQRKRGV